MERGPKVEVSSLIFALYVVFIAIGWPLLFYHNILEVGDIEDDISSLQARLTVLETA